MARCCWQARPVVTAGALSRAAKSDGFVTGLTSGGALLEVSDHALLAHARTGGSRRGVARRFPSPRTGGARRTPGRR